LGGLDAGDILCPFVVATASPATTVALAVAATTFVAEHLLFSSPSAHLRGTSIEGPAEVVQTDSAESQRTRDLIPVPAARDSGRPRFGVVANLAAYFSPQKKKRRRKSKSTMAAVAPMLPVVAVPAHIAGAVPGAIGEGSFAVVLAPLGRDELDEVFVGPRVPGTTEALHVIYTTTDAPPHPFVIQLMEIRAGQMDYGGAEAVIGTGLHRRLSPAQAGMPWNQICNPQTGAVWNPSAAQLGVVTAELQRVCNQQYMILVANAGLGDGMARFPDVAERRMIRAPMPPALMPGHVAPVPGLPLAAMMPPMAPPGHAPAGVAGVPGPGAGAVLGAGGGAAASELDLLKEVLEKMQLGGKSSKKKGKKDKKSSGSSSAKEKEDKKKKKHKHKGKKAKKEKFGIASSSSSSSNSSSSSDSSDSSGDDRFAGGPSSRTIGSGSCLRAML